MASVGALTISDLPIAEQAKFRQRVKELGFSSPREIVSKVYDMRHSDKWRNGWIDEDPARGLVFKRARANQVPPKFNEEFYPKIKLSERVNMAKALKAMPRHKAKVIRERLIQLGYSEDQFKKITWEIDEPTGDPRASGAWTVFLYLAGRGTGKLLDIDTPIPTPQGWTRLGDIKIGDEVFDESGRVCHVTKTYDDIPDVAYRLHFSDGTHIDACGDHQWVTWTHRERKAYLRSQYEDSTRFPPEWPQWICKTRSRWGGTNNNEQLIGPQVRNTQEIVDTFYQGSRQDLNHCIPTTLPLDLPTRNLPLDPYVFGLWLGDGSKACGDFTAHQDDHDYLCDVLDRAGFQPHTRKDPQTVATYGLTKILNVMGVKRMKHVPAEYLRASAPQRLDLLCGLMDSDGYVGSERSVVEFCNTDYMLIHAVEELARSLGHKPVVSESRAMLYGRDCGPKWRVTWRPTCPVFKMPRKRDRQLFQEAQSLRNHHRMITSFERIDSRPMRCLTVDGVNSMFLAGEGMIPTHNTRSASEWLDEQARLSPKGSQVLVAGRTPADVDSFMLNGPGGLLTNHPDIIYIPSKRKLIWPNGVVGIIRSGANPEEFRGFSGEIAWLDEFCAWAYAEAAWHNLILSLRERNPRVFISTTPRPLKILKTIMGQSKTITVLASTLENKANLSEIFIETVVEPMMDTRLGRQELSAEILDKVEGALWEYDDIHNHRFDPAKIHPDLVRVVVAVDPQGTKKDGAMTGIVVAGIAADDHIYVLHDGSVNAKPSEWANRAISLYRTHMADKIVAEKNFGGDMVLDTIRQIDKAANAALVNASRGKIQRAEPVHALYEKGMVHHYGFFPQLEDEMISFVPGGKKMKERTEEGEVTMESPNRLDALVWAIAALTEKTDEPPTRATWGRRRYKGGLGVKKNRAHMRGRKAA